MPSTLAFSVFPASSLLCVLTCLFFKSLLLPLTFAFGSNSFSLSASFTFSTTFFFYSHGILVFLNSSLFLY